MPQSAKPPTVIAASSGNDWLTAPAADQLELTLFGPGFGECAVLHVGGDRWIIVDSCQPAQTQTPVALEYLQGMGCEPANCVSLIVATHWHDDHIRGLDAVVRACPKALFSCSAALGTDEFEAMVLAYDGQRMIAAGSGVRELNGVFNTLQNRPLPPRRASASKALLRVEPGHSGHERTVNVIALSPSDHETRLAIAAIGKLMPVASATQYRCPPEEPNLMSVALHIEIGEVSLLLGADLEQHTDHRRGWSAVLTDTTLPKQKAVIFKLPHHGSKSSFSADVWEQRVAAEPIAMTTPWVRGARRIPTPADVGRIIDRTPHAYVTAMPTVGASAVARPPMVQRTLREMGAKIQRLEPATGAVRLRNGGAADWHTWHVDLRGPARQLKRDDAA